MNKISVVVPCYNEEKSLVIFYPQICAIAKQMDKQSFEFLFIDDGSTDKTLQVLENIASQDERVKYISFSRNFGKEAGIYAGLKNSTGDYTVLMDADLQHPPEFLPLMYQAVTQEGFDCAGARRINREGEPPLRSFFSRMFYRLINRISDTAIESGVTDFRMMSRTMVDAVLSMSEYNRFTKGLFSWVGFKTKWIPYQNVERVAGTTTWSFWGLVKYSLQGILNFSTVPLAAASMLGGIFCAFSFISIAAIVIKTFIWGDPVA
ncbi:MAG: glycosyltransferase family 2 protein, partial [Ruthenibacterium sp.]